MSDTYKDSYDSEDDSKFWLPTWLGSVYEHQASDFIVLDTLTGEQLTKKYVITWADARLGYFVESKKTNQGIRYVVHHNQNMQIIKSLDFYNATEEI